MAITTLYFGTNASAGAGTGVDWANRGRLINAGTWSSLITAFDFAAGNSLVCYIGQDGGNATATAAMASGLFSVSAPSAANPIIFAGCDATTGTPLTPPDPDWLSCKPSWDDSTLPVIATTTNIVTANLLTAVWRLVKFTASGRNGAVISAATALDWCSITNSTANTAASGVDAALLRAQNLLITMSGDSYNAGYIPQATGLIDNCRIMGVTGSSGDRRGIESNATSTAPLITRCTIIRHGGEGFASASTNAGQLIFMTDCVVANNGATGILATNTASQTAVYQIRNNMVTGNGTAGINGQSEANILLLTNRFRDNTTNITGLDNWPTDLGNYTTESDDASEYVDAANGTTSLQDYTIKSSATIATMGFGVAVQSSGGQRSYSF